MRSRGGRGRRRPLPPTGFELRASGDFYGPDLAAIHANAFEALAVAAAATLLRLTKTPPSSVLDLGCGAGRLSIELDKRGVPTWGVDISPDLVALARDRLPTGAFVDGSLLDTPFPPAGAAAAVGEVLNYATVAAPGDLARVFEKVHAALEAGGVFLFDLAGPGRVGPGRAFSQGSDWAVGMTAEEAEGMLVRRITTFRKATGGAWLRSDEDHRLRLWPPEGVIAALRSSGFRAERLRQYDDLALPEGLHVYVAVKGASGTG